MARPEERLVVELRLGDRTVAEAVAEVDRPDLLKAGIGDGRHAFSLPLTAECMQRRSEVAVVARAADGTCTPIPFRVRRKGGEETPAVQQAVQAIGSAQRRLQAELQDELRALANRLPEPEEREALRSLAASQARLEDRLEVLSLWLTRLDERIAALPTAEPVRPRRMDSWQAGLMALLGGIAALALSGLPQLLAR
jgi:hypothetical protein